MIALFRFDGSKKADQKKEKVADGVTLVRSKPSVSGYTDGEKGACRGKKQVGT